MKTIFLTIAVKFGLNKAALKMSVLLAFVSTAIADVAIENTPKNLLGVTIFLWITYIFTIFLDWSTGVTAAKVVAKRNNEKFKWDIEKAMSNLYKHALFVMIMSTVYFLQKEVVRKEFPQFIVTIISYVQFGYFIYNMVNEWISIEENRYKVTNKYSRLYKFLNRMLNIFDEAAINKIEKLTNTKEDEKAN